MTVAGAIAGRSWADLSDRQVRSFKLMWNDDYHTDLIAERFGMSADQVRMLARAMNLKQRSASRPGNRNFWR